MSELGSLAARALSKLGATARDPAVLATLASLLVFGLLMLLWERRQGRDPRRYLTRPVRTDAAYAAFYLSGVYAVFIWTPLYAGLEAIVQRAAPFLRLSALGEAGPVAQAAAFLVAVDLAQYWKHRLMHASPLLWRFHSIHHSQPEMTFLTSYRFHFVDELLNGVVRFVPGLLLGVPAPLWLPLTVALTWYQSLQHSDTGWSFGPLDRLLVSSRFHNVHHARDAVRHERNFGLFFSV